MSISPKKNADILITQNNNELYVANLSTEESHIASSPNDSCNIYYSLIFF
jgi:hypothetical protein